MTKVNPRPPALLAILIYKCFSAGLLTVVSIGLVFTSNNHDVLYDFANEYMTTGKREIIKFGLTHILNVSTNKMQIGALIAAIYAAVSGLEAFGLWQQKAWATILVVVIVGLTIPLEIYEIVHKISAIKLGVLAINVAMFVYLLRHALEEQKKHAT